jgi:hypothetical protein
MRFNANTRTVGAAGSIIKTLYVGLGLIARWLNAILLASAKVNGYGRLCTFTFRRGGVLNDLCYNRSHDVDVAVRTIDAFFAAAFGHLPLDRFRRIFRHTRPRPIQLLRRAKMTAAFLWRSVHRRSTSQFLHGKQTIRALSVWAFDCCDGRDN